MKKFIGMLSMVALIVLTTGCTTEITPTEPKTNDDTEVVVDDTTDQTTDPSNDGAVLLSTVVTVDINPSIQIELDENDEILSVTALNEDGQNVLDQIDLTDVTLDQLVDLILGEALAQEYIVDGEESFILFGIESEDEEASADLEANLAQTAVQSMENRGQATQVLVQKFESVLTDQDTGISAAKAKLLEELLVTGTYTIDDVPDLAVLSIKDLKDKLEEEFGVTVDEVMKASSENETLRLKLMEQVRELNPDLAESEYSDLSVDDLKDMVKEYRNVNEEAVKTEAAHANKVNSLEQKQLEQQEKADEKVAEIEEKTLDIQNQIAELETQLETATEDEVADLEAQIAELNGDLEELNNDLTEVQDELANELQEIEQEQAQEQNEYQEKVKEQANEHASNGNKPDKSNDSDEDVVTEDADTTTEENTTENADTEADQNGDTSTDGTTDQGTDNATDDTGTGAETTTDGTTDQGTDNATDDAGTGAETTTDSENNNATAA